MTDFIEDVLLVAEKHGIIARCVREEEPTKGNAHEKQNVHQEGSHKSTSWQKEAVDVTDSTYIKNLDNFIEELDDINIRLFSFIGALKLEKEYVEGLNKKIEKNKKRPVLHGKGF